MIKDKNDPHKVNIAREKAPSNIKVLPSYLNIATTNKILKKLEDYGFLVLSFGNSFNNPFEVIDEYYFNEKINEALT